MTRADPRDGRGRRASVLVGPERQDELGAALLEALAPYKTPSSGYILENESHFLVATSQ